MLSCKSHLVPLYKVVKNDKGKSYVKGFCVKPKDLTVKREKQRFNTKDANTDSFGRYKAERVVLHQRITVNIVNSCPKPKEGERPKVILLMGGAASGKSTIVKKYLEPKYGSHTFGVLNVDDIKEELPEYQKFASEDVETSANRVHEESSDIGKQVLRRIISEKRNFIYDAVLGNVQKANKIIDDLYFLGYDIELVGVTVNTEQAWERAVKRAIGENEKEDGSGRYIPEQPFFNGHRGIVETFEKFNRNKVDKYFLFDNNVNFGDDPILIEDNEGVKDEERKVEFLKKRNIYPELKKGAVPLYEFLLGYDILRKAFDYGSTTSEVFYKATKVIKNITDNLDARQSITFGDEEYRNISVNDLMEVIADNTDTIHYCDAIVTNQKGELLIIQRTSFDTFGAGKWCTPGGKVDQGEFLHQAVKRELLEETGLVATNCNYTCLYKNDDGSYSHYFWCYVDDYSQLYVDANEIQQYNWISPSNAYKYDFLLDCADRIMEIFNIPFKGKFLTKQELDAIASNKIEKAYTETSLETSYEKGCLMLDIDWVNRHGINKWHEILSKIDRDDVYEEAGYGLETKPHITILYGFKLPTVTPEHIERLLPDGAVTFKIKDVNFFEAENYDVLKFEIESEMLHELNSIYKVLEHENKFPDYNPHITIAYLKKGCAKKFANHYRALFADWINYQFQSTKFDYSFNDDYGKKAKAHWDVKGFETIEDAPEDKILKAKQYQIGEISQTTGMKKVAPGKWVDPKTGKPAKGEDEKGNEGKKNESLVNRELSDGELAEHAKHASESDLQNTIKNNRSPKLREFAQLELSRRKKEETPKEEKTDLKKTPEDNKEYQRDTMVKDILGALDSFIGDEFLISIQRPLEREFVESNKIYSEEERQKFFANLPTKRISLSSIKLVQGRVNKELVEKKRGRPKNLEPIHLFKIGDQYQVWDGNHRAIASILNGEKAIDAKVVDMTQNLKEENFKYHLDNDQRDTFIKGKDKFFKEKEK